MKKKLVLCTPIPQERYKEIEAYCDITIAGELKHGKGNVTEAILKEECMGHELVVLGDENAGADTIKAWADSGMKFIGVAKGTPVTVDHNALKALELELSYTPGRNRVAVAEFNIGLMIDIARNLSISAAGLKSGEHVGPEKNNIYDVEEKKNVTFGPLDENHPFTDYGIGFELYGKTLGIVGYGAIGREVAIRAKAFGMTILVYDPYIRQEAVKEDVHIVNLDEMLEQSDMISIHLPVTEATKELIDKSWFNKMKETAYVINTARAAVIHQKDFIDALERGRIKGAAVDVYWEEPIPANHPLLRMRNVVCTPHMAGLTTDVDYWSGEMMSKEVLAYLNNKQRQYLWKL